MKGMYSLLYGKIQQEVIITWSETSFCQGMLTRCEVVVEEQAFPKSSASPGLSGTFIAIRPEWQWQYYEECWIEYFCAQLVSLGVMLVVLTIYYCDFLASLQITGFSDIGQTRWRNICDEKTQNLFVVTVII